MTSLKLYTTKLRKLFSRNSDSSSIDKCDDDFCDSLSCPTTPDGRKLASSINFECLQNMTGNPCTPENLLVGSDTLHPYGDEVFAKYFTNDVFQRRQVFKTPSLSTGLLESPRPSYVDGQLTLKLHYLILSERFKISICNASGLFRTSFSEREITTFAEIRVIPGNVQKKSTDIVKGSRNPVFDSVVYYNGIPLDDLRQMSLLIVVYGKQAADDCFVNIGELLIALFDFDLTRENTLTEYLNTRICSRSQGEGSSRLRLVRQKRLSFN